MKRCSIGLLMVLVVAVMMGPPSLRAGENLAHAPVMKMFNDIEFLRSGLPMSEWIHLYYTEDADAHSEEGADGDGIQPMPGYVPPEEFIPGANPTVILDAAIGPNTLVNSRDLCLGRGIVQSETSMTVYGDVIVAAWNDARGFFCTNRSTLGWAYSFDGGQTFTDGGTLPGGRTPWSNGDPALAVDADGNFYVAGIGSNFGTMSVSRGTITDTGIAWGAPVRAVTGAGSIDKELLAVDQNTGIVYMAYGRSQSLEVIRSENGGATWSGPGRLGRSGIGIFPAFDLNSKMHLVWLAGWPSANQSLMAARSEDGGQTFTPSVLISRVCPFNVAGFSRGQMPAFPSVAIDKSGGNLTGRIYVTWHSSCDGPGAIYLSSSDDEGRTWSAPVIVNDDATTAIHFSPSVSVDDAGNVNVTFYDRRENPGTGVTNVYFAQSQDGGATFSQNVRVTDTATNWSAVRSDITPNMGDYMTSLSAGTDVLVVWSDGRQGDPDAYFARISAAALPKK